MSGSRDKIAMVLYVQNNMVLSHYGARYFSSRAPANISQDISRGIWRHGAILFRLYYDAKECTFTEYSGAARGDIGRRRGIAALLINLSRERAKRRMSNFHRCTARATRVFIFIRRERNAHPRCGFSHVYANQSTSANSAVLEASPPAPPVPFVQ